MTLVAGLVILGFPLALVFAWAYELTPAGIKPDSEVERSEHVDRVAGQRFNYVILSLIVVAVTILAVDRLMPNTARTHRATSIDTRRPPVIAANIMLDDAAPIAFGVAAAGIDSPMITVSPDGIWLVYVGRNDSGSQLYRRRLDGFAAAEAIPGTEGAINAFFSPDGQSIGFQTDSQLKRVPLEGDGVHTIANLRFPRHAYWTADDWVYLAENNCGSLQGVRALGGDVETVIEQIPGVFNDVLQDDSPWPFGTSPSTTITRMCCCWT